MSKHSTTPRTLSRRLAALLAALALLAAMALPVYAEALDGASQMQETVETDNNGETDNKVEAGSDVKTDDKSETNEGTGTGADTESEDTSDDTSPNTTGDSNTQADNAAADNTAPYEEKTDLTEEDTADDGEGPADEAGAKETFFAADTCSEDETGSSDMSAPMAASNEGETTTIYFAVDSNYQETYRVNLYVQKNNGEGLNKDMSYTGKTKTDSDGTERKIFSVTLSQADYPGGGFDRLIFQYFTGTTWERDFFAFGGRSNGDKAWTSIDKIAGKMYDGQKYGSNPGQAFNESQWTRVEYAGMPLYFKNASDTPLAGVTATFYKKGDNGTFVETGSQTIGTVEANTIANQKITIPDNQSQFVKFTWEGNGEGTLYYNFSNEVCDGIANFDLVANNCFVYSGSAESPWQNAGGDLLTADKTIYFDSTFSSYAYAGENTPQNAMPKTGDDGSAKMYCFLQKADGSFDTVEMTSAPDPNAADRQLWSCEIPSNEKTYTAVQFSATNDQNAAAKDDKTKVYSTANIPPTLQEPCFFADNGDPKAYENGNVYREGYWDEKDATRDAESGKGTTVVDIASDKFTQEAGTKYITSTLYDYYTDYELNGFNRDSYPDGGTNSQRWFVTFEQFDRALSRAYEKNGQVQYPLYTGHFQPTIGDWSCPFKDVAVGMKLYGWSDNTNSPEYKTFMAVNNSVLDKNGDRGNDEASYARTFQGLVEDKTSTGNANGLPVLKGTTNLVDPHFDKEFLEGENTFKTVLGKVYEDVAFPFTQDAVFKSTGGENDKEAKAEYWYYDSSKSSLYLTQDEGNSKFFLKSTKDDTSGELTTDSKSANRLYNNGTNDTYGFFPFNKSVGSDNASQYNYGFGAKLQFDFTLTNDGMVQVGDKPEDKVPIKFFFSGDDDVWVYIDGQLVLDVGGAHGKASGLLEFGKTADGNANTVTPYVSSNKAGGATYTDDAQNKYVYFNGKKVTFEKKGKISGEGNKPFTLAKGTTHTLTMFYMERGMWESNMAVAFNFPDHNELQVEKKVDVTGVNKLFKNSFQNQKIFTFNIQNLATHYAAKDTSYKEGATKALPEETYKNANAENPSDTSAKLVYAAEPPDSKAGDLAVLWSATMDDPTSKYREQRRGALPLSETIDIRQYSYLTFDVYVKSKKGNESDTCALGNLYVELWDTQGNQKGCINGKGLQSSDVYGAATGLHPGQWYTIRLMLKSLETSGSFNNTLKRITVGDNFAREIYLRNFTFRSAPKEQTTTGFTTEQYNIPDYGSATSGTLQNAAYAVFSSDRGNGDIVDEDGQFLLQAGETVTFKDQFRRGSYIALKELTDTELYDTSWTVYENGEPVTSVNGIEGVVKADSSVTTLKDVPGTAPNDGRTELVINGNDKNGNPIKNAYDSTAKKPADDTLVFRSYSGTADKDELTKLKVVFTNKVKTGKLIIRKEPAPDETLDGQTFTFTVKFSDVGGQGLGNEIEPQTYTCKVKQHGKEYYGEVVIDKIPVGTRFVVSENETADTSLQSVSITGGGTDCAVTEDGKRVRGAIAEGDGNAVTATFVNTRRQLIDIEVTKQWKKQNGTTDIPSNELPKAIYLKLQRTETPKDETSWETVSEYDSVELNHAGYEGWTKLFTGLDKYDANKAENDRILYTYRVLESATGKGDWRGGKDDDVIEIDGKKYTILHNTVQVKKDSTSPLALNLTNTQQDPKFTLDITKADAENGSTPLKDVEFTLEQLDENNNVVAGSAKYGITNNLGKLMSKGEDGKPTDASAFTGLEAGKYRLTETKAAENYNLLSAPILVTFGKDGTCTLNGSKIEVSTTEKRTEFTKNEDGSYTLALTVLNRKTPALPHTGADAPSLWLLIGLPLAVAGLLILVFRYNKKGGRTR